MLPQTADAGLAVIDILADARIVYLIIYVNDLAVSTAFYERQLGLRVIESDENSVKLDAGLVVICLHRATDYGVKLAGRSDDASDVVFLVDDINAVREDLQARGIEFVRRRTYEIGLVTDFYDPNGHRLMIYQPSPTALSWASGEKLRKVWRATGKGSSEPIGTPAVEEPAGGTGGGLDGKPLIYLFMFVPNSADAAAFYGDMLGLHAIESVHCCNPACPPEEKGVAKYDGGGILLTTHHVHRSPVVDDFGRIYSPKAVDSNHTRGIVPVFLVQDIKGTVERLSQRGVAFDTGIVVSQIGEVAKFEATTGHMFYLYEPRNEALKWPVGAKIRQILAS